MSDPPHDLPVSPEMLEDFADARAAREALAEIEAGASPIPADQVWAALGLDS